MSNDEKRDIEDRINDAMAKIVSDTAGEPQPENKNNRSAAHKSARPSKSARPRKITYVPIDESEFEPIVIPEKKKHKALKVTGMIAAMVLVVAGCAYVIIIPVISLRAQRLTGSTAPTGLHMRLSRRSQKKWKAIPSR